ncbi:hypothetical protein FKW77_009558 [Venturia effusa]|uniref:SGNH hydrolase-type esterase domain-containing protein n=1 Tax=Venturia effusa TaxID=50376 RepID=A0A517L208_9PEZI|nr:hypothetical protein FKW77_009558 [Venturia effusa]
MVHLISILSLSFISSATAVALPSSAKPHSPCGNTNIIFTGFPPYHPTVRAEGFDSRMVDQALKADAKAILAAGYNLKTVFMGPEKDISIFAKYLDGTQWHGAGVGYGIRGSRIPEVTVRLEDILKVYREKAASAEVVFNYSPNSTLWALNRRLPLPKDCGPGKDLGSKTSTGGYIWPRYVSWYYPSLSLHNYAVSGAVCSNTITPRTFLSQIDLLFPSVLEYEIPAFLADKAFTGPSTSTTAPINIDDSRTVYAIWIGTNDLGNDAFLTDSQVQGKQITDYIDCVYESLERVYAAGGRWFVLMNVIPLNLAPQYALPSDGGAATTRYFADKTSFNSTEISYRMMDQVGLVNEAFRYRTPFEVKLGDKFKEARFANFDVHSLVSCCTFHSYQGLSRNHI